jgi:hypothetical protein
MLPPGYETATLKLKAAGSSVVTLSGKKWSHHSQCPTYLVTAVSHNVDTRIKHGNGHRYEEVSSLKGSEGAHAWNLTPVKQAECGGPVPTVLQHVL